MSDEIQRQWFVRFAIVLMSVALLIGAVPLLKSTFFPVEKSRAQ